MSHSSGKAEKEIQRREKFTHKLEPNMEEEDQTRPFHQVSVDNDDIKGANSHQSDGERATNAPQSSSRLPSKNLKKQKESMANIRNALLVVAVLITSTTYQAVLQPPSFITKVDKNSTKGFQGYMHLG
ncbi:hypothetical protein NL676_009355 [Syzygium grande]|nr:hypothetical protein NL676_009355 [Syzygium grande]